MKKYLAILAIITVVVSGVLIWRGQTSKNKLIAEVFYRCDAGKTINASYYQGAPAPQPKPGEPPTPTGSVSVKLSDGRQLTLPQTISASGIRYANPDESFIFWSKGSGALVLENNLQTYIGCIEVVSDPGGLPQVYENGQQGFSIRYPSDYKINEGYQYYGFGPERQIGGVSFTIPSSVAEGTNLGRDSYISVEEIPQAKECDPGLFLDEGALGVHNVSLTENNTDYLVASSTGAGAGNRYEETVYAIPYTNPCMAVRYFIHYSVFENYPPGAVRRFDKQALLNQFDAIRRTLTIQQ